MSDSPLTDDQQELTYLASSFVLEFLVRPERRARKLNGMEDFSDSACFHRLHDLCWSFRDSQAAILLNDEERAVLAEFTRTFDALPWEVIPAHPHINELPNDDLSPLLPSGEKLLNLLDTRSANLRHFAWLRRLWRGVSSSRPQPRRDA